MSKRKPKSLLVVTGESLNQLLPGENAVKKRLESLGYKVEVKDAQNLSAIDTRGKALVVISSLVKTTKLGRRLRDGPVPIIASSTELYTSLRMCGGGPTAGLAPNESEIEIIHPKRPGHGMMAKKTGTVKIAPASGPMDICWATELAKEAVAIAALKRSAPNQSQSSFFKRWISLLIQYIRVGNDPAASWVHEVLPRHVLFGFRVTTPMFGEKNKKEPKNFAGRRIGFPLDYRKKPTQAALMELFDEAVNWAVGKINTRQFDEVFREEWQEVYKRRLSAYAPDPANDPTGFDGKSAPQNLVGLALSGGGIRSATFCLGVLQGLHELKLLRIFDYLSTVSGGGYLGGWWSAWLSRNRDAQNQDIFPSREDIEPERLDDYRWRTGSAKVAEGSLSAGRDPIHHLRLFSNYLTPRKGMLSADTWRAITVLTRNLLLTWLMLLPLLLAFVIAVQSLFMIYQQKEFFHPYWFELQTTVQEPEQAASLITDEKDLKKLNQETEAILKQPRSEYGRILKQRAFFILGLLIPFIGWIALLFWAFMRSNGAVPLPVKLWDRLISNDKRSFRWRVAAAHFLGTLGVGVIAFFAIVLAWPSIPPTVKDRLIRITDWLEPQWAAWKWGLIVWMFLGFCLLLITMPWRSLKETRDAKNEDELRLDVWRNKISRRHGQLLITLVLMAVVLVFAAYGHEIFDYLWRDTGPRNLFLGYIAKIGGWGAFAGAIFGTIFSALKSAPTGGHDVAEVKQSPRWQKAIFAITPLLVIITLMILAAWTAHKISRPLAAYKEHPWHLSVIILVGIFIALFFALYEIQWNTSKVHRFLLPGAFLLIVGSFFLFWQQIGLSHSGHVRLLRATAVAAGLLFIRLRLKGDRWSGGFGRLTVSLFNKKPSKKSKEKKSKLTAARSAAALIIPAIVIALLGCWFAGRLGPTTSDHSWMTLSAFAGIVLTAIYILIEAFCGKGDNRRSLFLFASVFFISLLLMLTSFFSTEATRFSYVSLGLFAATLTWVMALGWMADPNAISMHGFYKGRLVRAYLGASNPRRVKKLYEITETVVGDDVLLSDMKNCERGAPYHLLNTTLNLTGGRDLATAQRSSAAFVLSKLYCGSFRTGFQRSTRYTNGRLSLGMAVATSGAAVSPGMGAGKTTAAQAMLMTLLNLRLGFWAPTPSGEHWESPQARLWPFYTVREFLSQTNDLSSYCYLTDGGHFDNLGIYSLVERGCRHIVAVDAVADPQPCFSDLGNAIRRCRIDFGADIDLDITPFVKSKDDAFAKQHYSFGRIIYAEEHVKRLGWKDISEEARTGMIVYIKSSLLKNEKELRTDVRQYGLENFDFPQQSTVNQWFDEAQFESYRQLGEHCAETVFNKIDKDPRKAKREGLIKKKSTAENTMTLYEKNLLQEMVVEAELLAVIKKTRTDLDGVD